MILAPKLADVEDALMRLLCIGRLRIVNKLRGAEEDAELDQERRDYLRDAKQRSRVRKGHR